MKRNGLTAPAALAVATAPSPRPSDCVTSESPGSVNAAGASLSKVRPKGFEPLAF
jgi:hypothetical protein